MKCEIIAVGTEVVTGDIVNSNAPYIAKELNNIGIETAFHSAVRDEMEDMISVLEIACSRADLIITIGGLGPTYDDITREAVSRVSGKALVPSKEVEESIRSYFKKLGREMTENNLRQAQVFADGTVFSNQCGTAPGLAVESEKKVFILLPGPPRELQPMFSHQVIPYLTKKSHTFIKEKTLKVFGMGESAIETLLHDLMINTKNPILAPYAKTGEVFLKLTAHGSSPEEAEKILRPVYDKVYARLEKYIYGEDEDTLAGKAMELLHKKGRKVAFCESCTGGYVAKMLTDIPGSSQVFDCGVVTYSNAIKSKIVGVSPLVLKNQGAVCEETALQMAKGIRQLSGADIGISVTGIAGPDGGSEEKPVGLVYIGFHTAGASVTRQLNLSGNRDNIRTMTVKNVFSMLIDYLK